MHMKRFFACPFACPAALLPALLRVQQLDGVDVEGAAPLYQSMCHKLQVCPCVTSVCVKRAESAFVVVIASVQH